MNMRFEIKDSEFLKDGEKIKIISGAVHYFRNVPDTWNDIFLKMKALGCNCVETYCAWNMHEKVPYKYDFTGILDVAEFIRTAQKHGLMVIVRPGPYICSEFEFGGLPWWLLSDEEIEIRCMNKKFIMHFERYLKRLFEEIRPLLCSNGGPIIMLQCENEYGFYGDDKEYLQYLRDFFVKQGMDVPLFTSDGPTEENLLDGTIEGCLSTMNFGSRVDENLAMYEKLFPNSPKMCMEMWNGWFDAWGDEKHHTTSTETYAQVVDDMLQRGSVNIYMFIGGTNFGFTSGALHNEKYAPTVTSYDYDALLTEWGDITPKYLEVRKVIQRYVDTELPQIPENREKKAYGKIVLGEQLGFFEALPQLATPVYSNVPKSMESYKTGYGYIAYQTKLKRDYMNAILEVEDIGDRAHVFVNEKQVDILYVNDRKNTHIDAKAGDVLTILCENMGRINFGVNMMRKKGIIGRCFLNGKIHFHWDVFSLPMDNLAKLRFSNKQFSEKSGFYRGYLYVHDTPKDTFIKLDAFRKGFCVVNGFNLGRYWEKGPQKTLYVPASVLKEGQNEIVVFESDGVKDVPTIEFIDQPVLSTE